MRGQNFGILANNLTLVAMSCDIYWKHSFSLGLGTSYFYEWIRITSSCQNISKSAPFEFGNFTFLKIFLPYGFQNELFQKFNLIRQSATSSYHISNHLEIMYGLHSIERLNVMLPRKLLSLFNRNTLNLCYLWNCTLFTFPLTWVIIKATIWLLKLYTLYYMLITP